MPQANFTTRWIASLQPDPNKQVDYFDSRTSGLGLRISPGGTKAWFIWYRIGGRLKKTTLGRYPKMGLAVARRKAKHELGRVAKADDPAAEQRAERLAESFEELALEYLEKHAKGHKRSWREDERIINRELLPRWRRRKANDITKRDVIAMVDEIVSRAPAMANMVLAITRKIFNWGISRDMIRANPCYRVPRPHTPKARDRVLGAEEILTFWNTLDEAGMSEHVRLILRIQLLTAQRPGEVAGARWDEFDFDTNWWTVPAERSKNKLTHRVPLTPWVVELLDATRKLSLDSDYLFSMKKQKTSTLEPITSNAVSHAVHKNLKIFGIPHFTPHDLRRTAASHMTSMGVSRLVVDKLLNHIETGVIRVYDRHSYDQEKTQALQLWADKLHEIICGDRSAKLMTLVK